MTRAEHCFTISVDIADQHDYTALAFLHSYEEHKPGVDAFHDARPKRRPRRTFELQHLERWRHIGYPEQVRRIGERYEEIRRHVAVLGLASARTELVIDATGVGRPVLDLLRDAGLRPQGVVITSGSEKTRQKGGIIGVPKAMLATTLQVVLQSGRLRLSDDLPLADVLEQELAGFRVAFTPSGNLRFGNDVGEWRTSAHDDLVLAVAIGVWKVEHVRITSRAVALKIAGLV